VTSADTVKVVTDEHDYALLFSHEPVPKRCPMNSYDAEVRYKIRVGIQACRCDFLEKYATLKGKSKSSREFDKENGKVIVDPDEPEQNRVVFAGHRVKVDVVEDTFVPGVKTPEDLRRLNAGLGTGLVNDLALTFLVA
jgi:CMP-2-keto-3-deoxyoctulosonic acid synthetase